MSDWAKLTFVGLFCPIVGAYGGCNSLTVHPDGSVPLWDAAVDDGGATAGHSAAGAHAAGSGGHAAGHPAPDDDAGVMTEPLGEPTCSTDACRHGGSCLEPSLITCQCPDTSMPACGEIRFRSLGVLADSLGTAAFALSDDGSTVVGGAGFDVGDRRVRQAVRWTLQEGLVAVELPTMQAERFDAILTSVSADGAVACGYALPYGFDAGFCWRNGRAEYLQPGDLRPSIDIYDLSADGQTLIGVREDEPANAFRWTAADGFIELPPFPGDEISNAFAMSADGKAAAGISGQSGSVDAGSSYYYRPVVWREGSAVARLPELPNMTDMMPEDMNADGTVVVGSGTLVKAAGNDNMRAALRWSSSGVERLSEMPAAALGISANGSVIVGFQSDEATVWTADLEAHSLAQLLAQAGVDLSSWTLMTAQSVSADGKVIVGSGVHDSRTLAFIAWLP